MDIETTMITFGKAHTLLVTLIFCSSVPISQSSGTLHAPCQDPETEAAKFRLAIIIIPLHENKDLLGH